MSSTPDESEDVITGRLRENWFSSIWELSNLTLQQRRWLDPQNRNPHWSYIEFVESYPSADQLADARSRERLSAQEFALLQQLEQKLLNYFAPNGDDHDNSAVLADPAWHEVVATAWHTREELLKAIASPNEREALLVGVLSGA